MKINLFGERNTGTNWLASLLERSGHTVDTQDKHLYRAKTSGHMRDPFDDPLNSAFPLNHKRYIEHYKLNDAKAVIYLCKNPLSWLKSMNRQPYHLHGLTEMIDGNPCNLLMDKFLRSKANEYSGTSTEFHSGVAVDQVGNYKNIIEIRNEKNKFFKGVAGLLTNCHVIRYEDLLFKTGETLSKLGLNIEDQPDKEYHTGYHPARRSMPKTFSEKNRKYYKDEEYLQEFSTEDKIFILNNLDIELEYWLGYDLHNFFK
ncbi:MAG: hypothetical protein CL885_00165 [Dehalococcoidia bacterium]|nr:hypothetical protein [Dehalococcoidia bacterium]